MPAEVLRVVVPGLVAARRGLLPPSIRVQDVQAAVPVDILARYEAFFDRDGFAATLKAQGRLGKARMGFGLLAARSITVLQTRRAPKHCEFVVRATLRQHNIVRSSQQLTINALE